MVSFEFFMSMNFEVPFSSKKNKKTRNLTQKVKVVILNKS